MKNLKNGLLLNDESKLQQFLTLRTVGLGLLSFIIVLLFMPLGHALMVLNEKILLNHKLLGAGLIGAIGLFCLIVGLNIQKNQTAMALLGLIAGVLVWTGWIEFSFVWIADKLEVMPYMENGEVATKPEYLIMPSSIGILAAMCLLFIFSDTRCKFYVWIQKILRIKKSIAVQSKQKKPIVITTFIETIMIIWTFYIVLLLVYDGNIAGDRHPLTYITAFGSLAWSFYLIFNLFKISRFDYSISYAIPTVVIFWNFIEILGRWDLFKEIWIHPFEYKMEIILTTLLLIFLIGLLVYNTKKGNLKIKNSI